MKKLISFIVLTMLLSLATAPAHAAVTEDEGIISLLKELEIMQGDENGDMMLDRKVSRAEFAKIAIAASPQKNSVAVGLRQSPFRDVPYTQWYAPYVKASVTAGYVVGYLDATFRPENTVTYEEAATILLRVLGNDDSAYSDAYPYGQLAKAQSLDLLDDVNGEIGEELTRYQVMRMVYNTLGASMSQGGNLYSTHDTAMTENVDVIATDEQDDSLGADKVFTSAGTYNKGDYFNDNSVGMTGTIYIKNNKDLVAFVPDNGTGGGYESYFVYSVLSNSSIVGYKNGYFEEIDVPDGATVYKNQSRTTYAAVKNTLEMGDTLYIKRTKNGSVDYVTYDTNNLEGPVKVTGDGWLSQLGASSSSKVFRSGVESTASSVLTNDIVYYSAPLDVVFAYTDKVTGIYEKASPTKDSPESVTISGKEYKVESVEAFKDLSSSGSYKYGDTITILLGRTGEVAGVAGGSVQTASNTASSKSGSSAGYVIEAGKKDFTNADSTAYSSYYIKVVSPDGTVSEYPTSSNYSTSVCSAVNITLKNGKASISRKSSSSGLSGTVNASKGVIGSVSMADNIKILDTMGTAYDDVPAYCTVYPQRIDGVNLTSSNVLYYSKNSAGEVDELILKDVTGDTYSFGVITSRDKTTGAYTIDFDGTQNTYMTGFSSTATGPHRFKMQNGTIKGMTQLSAYSGYITELTRTEAAIGTQKYLLSDKVVVYTRNTASTYMKIPLDDAINGNYRLTAYYDRQQTSGGRIRIIIAQSK